MKIVKFGVVGLLVGLLAGCSGPTGYGPKETVGTLGGAALGGLAGSQISGGGAAATAVGVVIGGLIGNQIGRYMDEQDRQYALQAEYAALERYPDGQQSAWNNPNNGNSGYTVPTNTYQTASGQYCREYQTTVVINGRPQTGYGTACRQPDGTWQIVS